MAPPRSPARRRVRALAQVLGVLVALYAGLLLVLSRDGVQATLRGKIESALRARLLGEVTVGQEVHVDPLLRVTFGPVVLAGSRPADAPLLRIERVRVRPRLWSLLMARVEPASVRLYGVRLELPDREHVLRELGQRLRRPARKPSGPPAPGVEAAAAEEEEGAAAPILVRNLVVAFHAAGRDWETGPIHLLLRRARSGEGSQLELDLQLPDDGSGALELRRDRTGWHGTLRLSGLGPGLLQARPQAEPPALAAGRPPIDAASWSGTPGRGPIPVAWIGGTLELAAHGDAAPDLATADGHLTASLTGLTVEGDAIAPTPVGPLAGALEGRLRWDRAEQRVSLTGGRASTLGAAVQLEGEARLGPGLPFSFSARADGVDYAAVVGALPGALAPPPQAPRPAGTFDAHLGLSGPLQVPGAWTVDAAIDLSRMREAARKAPAVALRGSFQHRPTLDTGAAPVLTVGPASGDFVPVAELPGYVVRAVTASEDGGFFGHQGFDFEELRNAVAEGQDGKRTRMRGGSTITQQLAKNLYLTRSRTLARKVREAVITIGLEASVPKGRLMEIYLNVVEWGPGLWGIGPAARHWFGKDARQLTPREAAFLATVIPNPVRFHFMWNRGATTETWDARVDRLLGRMAEQGSLTPEELEAALAQRLVFASPSAAVPPGTEEPGEAEGLEGEDR
ncbi:MAG: biosynthetic peptidoglycan transglycosylase [Anaeromyxobacter sp.]